MSLIIDILKKLEGKTKKTKVHPALLKRAKDVQDRKRYIFLAFSMLFAISALGAYFISDKILSSTVQPDIEIERIVASVEGPKPTEETEYTNQSIPATVEEGIPEDEVPEPTIVKRVQQPVQIEEKAEEKPKETKEELEEKPKPVPVRINEETGVEKVISDIVPEKTEPAEEPETTAEAKEELSTAELKSPPKRKEETVKQAEQLIEPSRRTPKESFEKLAYFADRSFKEGNLIDSMRYYEEALSVRDDTKVANNLVVVYVKLGLYEKARDLVLKTRNEKLAYTYIVELAKSGEVNRAVREGEELKGLDISGKLFFALGYAYEAMGDTGEALEYYRKAYKKNPGDPYVAVNYARMLEAVGNLREAYRVYRNLNFTNLDPKLKSLIKERLSYLRNLGF